jgi:hypothetical protein
LKTTRWGQVLARLFSSVYCPLLEMISTDVVSRIKFIFHVLIRGVLPSPGEWAPTADTYKRHVNRSLLDKVAI